MVQADLQIKHQAQAAGGQLVNIRGLDIAPSIAEVGIAEVIGHNKDDVGFVCGLQRCTTQQNND